MTAVAKILVKRGVYLNITTMDSYSSYSFVNLMRTMRDQTRCCVIDIVYIFVM